MCEHEAPSVDGPLPCASARIVPFRRAARRRTRPVGARSENESQVTRLRSGRTTSDHMCAYISQDTKSAGARRLLGGVPSRGLRQIFKRKLGDGYWPEGPLQITHWLRRLGARAAAVRLARTTRRRYFGPTKGVQVPASRGDEAGREGPGVLVGVLRRSSPITRFLGQPLERLADTPTARRLMPDDCIMSLDS